MSVIERIRAKIRSRAYYLSAHTEEEMVDDLFERRDVENAIFHGFIQKKLTHDVRERITELKDPQRRLLEAPGLRGGRPQGLLHGRESRSSTSLRWDG